jgi:hypothetical protein
MALVNPNIALGVQPVQLADPMAQYGRIAQFQAAQNQNALAQYQLGAAKRGEETQNVLAQAYAQSVDPTTGKIDYNKLTSLVAGGGGGAQLPGIEKTRREVETAGLTQQKAQSDLLDSKLKQSRGFLDTIDPADPTAPAKYLAWHEANHRDPVIGAALTARGVSAEQARQSIEAAIAKGPAAFAQMVAQSKLGTEKFMEMNKPTTSVGPTGIVQIPGLGGAPVVVPGTSAAFQMTPAQIAANKIAQQQLGVSQGQLGVAQQRLAQEGQGVTYQQDAQGNIVALPSRLAAGGMPVARPVTGKGGVAIKGKPSAFAEKATAQRQQLGKDINQAIFELKNVAKEGGLIDQSTGSGAGKLIDIAAGFGGKAMPGAIAAGQLAPIADLVLKMVPRFEGPQSDKDTQSYKQAAGQLADTSLPTKIRKAAANEIIRLMESRKNQFASSDMAAEGVTPTAPRIAPPAGFTPDQQ